MRFGKESRRVGKWCGWVGKCPIRPVIFLLSRRSAGFKFRSIVVIFKKIPPPCLVGGSLYLLGYDWNYHGSKKPEIQQKNGY
jgi:hypothetical protein